MAVPPIVKATLQAVVINAGSNVLAQYIKAYRNDVSILSSISRLLFYAPTKQQVARGAACGFAMYNKVRG